MPSRPERDYEGIPLAERPIDHIAGTLGRVLGPKLTAYSIAEPDANRIRRYAARMEAPNQEHERRLHDVAVVTDAIRRLEADETVRAVIIGANPLLDDRSAADMLHEDEPKYIEALKANAHLLAG